MSTDDHTKRLMDGDIWVDFCERLKELGELVRRPETPDDPQNRALGYRYLTQLLRAGLEATVDYADPEFPATHTVTGDEAYFQTKPFDGDLGFCKYPIDGAEAAATSMLQDTIRDFAARHPRVFAQRQGDVVGNVQPVDQSTVLEQVAHPLAQRRESLR